MVFEKGDCSSELESATESNWTTISTKEYTVQCQGCWGKLIICIQNHRFNICVCFQVPCAFRDGKTRKIRCYSVPEGSQLHWCSCSVKEELQNDFLCTQRGTIQHQGLITRVSVGVSIEIYGLCLHCNCSLQVTFRNKVTGEFLFYLVTFKLTPPGVLSTMELQTAVRQTVSTSVTVENPLSAPICLTSECKCPDIFAPSQLTVQGKSKV